MPASEDVQVTLGDQDYWWFPRAVVSRITGEFPQCDLTATRVFTTLHRLASAMVYDIEASVHRPAGGSWASYQLLSALWMAGPLSPHRAAEMAGMSRAAVSNLTGTLERKGLLHKKASPVDGRSVTLHLTPAGTAKIQEAFMQQNERESHWNAALTEQESELLISLLEKIMRHSTAIDAKTRR